MTTGTMKLLALLLINALPASPGLPVVDLSKDTARHVVIARGTPEVYQGHPTTLLMPDGKTMFCVWTLDHGGPCGPMKRSDDGGRTWSELLPVPESWTQVKNCPAIYRLIDPQGVARLFVFAGQGPDGTMHQSFSNDNGKTWDPMRSNGLTSVMPFCTIVPVEGGKKLIGLTNIRRPGETKDKRSNAVAQSESTDGGLTWSPWRILVDRANLKPCEPEVVRSPNGRQLLCLLRENVRTEPGHFMTSDDEGQTWSDIRDLPAGLHGDRHKATYAPDGRLVICFRDMGATSPTKNHFVAWVGRYEDIVGGRGGQYKIKLLHSHRGSDCGYPGLEALPDGTLVATTYVKYRPGAEQNSVLSTRFRLDEIDGLQLVSAKLATAEHSGKRDPGFGGARADGRESMEAARLRLAAAVAVSPLAATTSTNAPPVPPPHEPVRLARGARPGDLDGKPFDVVVLGGTAGGVACAVRAAREGCSVLLVQHNGHIGGMMSNGLMQWDALYGGHRSPLFSELLANIERHYINTRGEGSRDHQTIRYTHEHYPIGWAEPHVAEREFNRLVAAEKNITLLLDHYPTRVTREGRLVRQTFLSATPHARAGVAASREIRVSATTFVDATYEGDLFALAGVPYRVGREARDEYGEPHAGVVFCNIDKGPAPLDAVEGRLNIRPYNSKQGAIDPTSPFSADGYVQAYNYRFCVTRDPANRITPTRPPPGYDREEYVHYERKGIATNAGPNQKSHMNSPILPGENQAYPEADWPTRHEITERHLNFALGLMYFLQNDESIPEAKRAAFREWGLPKDEFADNGHVPYEMYVREARRVVGRHVFTEHDNSLAPGLGRTPIHADSIAITDWYMDSHSCTTNSRPGFHYDGKLILTEESRPAQIPYRSLLPQGVDNLLVPVCLSATHVAWGAVRLEPVWMQTGEAAGFAAALASKHKTTPAKLDADLLVRALIARGQLVSFFNDLSVAEKQPWVAAAQYFGTKGFFSSYDVHPAAPLKESIAAAWSDGIARLIAGTIDPHALARAVAAAERSECAPVTAAGFAKLLPEAPSPPPEPFTRQAALEMMWHAIPLKE